MHKKVPGSNPIIGDCESEHDNNHSFYFYNNLVLFMIIFNTFC